MSQALEQAQQLAVRARRLRVEAFDLGAEPDTAVRAEKAAALSLANSAEDLARKAYGILIVTPERLFAREMIEYTEWMVYAQLCGQARRAPDEALLSALSCLKTVTDADIRGSELILSLVGSLLKKAEGHLAACGGNSPAAGENTEGRRVYLQQRYGALTRYTSAAAVTLAQAAVYNEGKLPRLPEILFEAVKYLLEAVKYDLDTANKLLPPSITTDTPGSGLPDWDFLPGFNDEEGRKEYIQQLDRYRDQTLFALGSDGTALGFLIAGEEEAAALSELLDTLFSELDKLRDDAGEVEVLPLAKAPPAAHTSD